MLRRYAPSEHIQCKLYKRKKNSLEYEENPINFNAEIIEDENKQKFRIISGVIATKSTMRIKTSNLSIKVTNDDKIEIFGVIHMIQAVAIVTTDNFMLNNSKFSDDYILQNAPKIISL